MQLLERHFPNAEIVYERQEEIQSLLPAAQTGLRGLDDHEGNVMFLPANMPLLQANTLLCLEAIIAEDPRNTVEPLSKNSKF